MSDAVESVPSHPPSPSPSSAAAEISQWLQAYVARITGLAAEQVDVHAPFERFGIDSYQGAVMAHELEGWLGRGIDMTAPFDHASIHALTLHLCPPDGDTP